MVTKESSSLLKTKTIITSPLKVTDRSVTSKETIKRFDEHDQDSLNKYIYEVDNRQIKDDLSNPNNESSLDPAKLIQNPIKTSTSFAAHS